VVEGGMVMEEPEKVPSRPWGAGEMPFRGEFIGE